MSNEIEHVDTAEIICPWCGEENTEVRDVFKSDNGKWILICNDCGEKSNFDADEWSGYTTTKIEPEGKPDATA